MNRDNPANIHPTDSFLTRSIKLMKHFFNSNSILSKRLPSIYGPHSLMTKIFKLYYLTYLGFLYYQKYDIFLKSLIGFTSNALGVLTMLGIYGGVVKFMSITHLLSLSYPMYLVVKELLENEMGGYSVVCGCALLFYVPVLLFDVWDLVQLFVWKKYYCLMPTGVVHPLVGWFGVDHSVSLDMKVMFRTAVDVE
eukprot:TRINITY_DN9748_c0_g1_i1.p1 TRINITY_DN9748_c0_g1~~TRINITY_DN9748_c0_g1_i1.p1  ORF type:complete len:194 (+),score=14.58 TRINITY_DN9748_c0_g1_i1:26-607(+)